MKEVEVESAVVEFLKKEGFLCLPDKEKGWKKFSFYDDKISYPDVVAFRWEDDYDIHVKAVECKAGGSLLNIRSALDQILLYQRHFPWCYIATKRPSKENTKNLGFLRDSYHVGYIPVDEGSPPSARNALLDLEPAHTNTELNEPCFILTRQKLVMISTFVEAFGEGVNLSFEGNHGYLNTRGDFQYNINNYTPDCSVRFGVNIEKTGPVRRTLDGAMGDLVESAKELEMGDFILEIKKSRYSRRRPRRSMRASLIRKPIRLMRPEDSTYLDMKIKELGHQVEFTLQRIIWAFDEILSKEHHLERLMEAKRTIDGLKSKMKW
jgi:hypothetical protein